MSEYNIDKLNNPDKNSDNSANDGNIIGAIIVGAIAAVIVSVVWAFITVMAERQWAIMAIGAGAVVGYAIKMFAKFDSTAYGIVGAIFSLIACVLGDFLTNIGFIASNEKMSFLETLSSVDLAYFFEIAFLDFDFMSLIFYGIAIYLGYSLASNSDVK